MKSLAIWTDSNKREVKSIELHLNIWKLPNERSYLKKIDYHRVIDFGLMLDFKEENTPKKSKKKSKKSDIGILKIYYPAKVEENDIIDLVSCLYDNIESKLISTLFNENLNLKINSNSDFATVETTEKENFKSFMTYKLKSSNISIEHMGEGSIIQVSIPLDKIEPSNSKVYIRFRIKSDYSKAFCTISKPANSALQSQFSDTELFNFKINEVRDISNDLLEKISNERCKLAKFSKIHLFYICSASDEYVFSHRNFDSVRILERDKWNSYLDFDMLDAKYNILAYHFKEKPKEVITSLSKEDVKKVILDTLTECKAKQVNLKETKKSGKSKKHLIEDFNFLFQTKFEKNNRLTIFKYIVFLFCITLLFNIISSFIWDSKDNIVTYFLDSIIAVINLLLNNFLLILMLSVGMIFLILLLVIYKKVSTLKQK